MGVYTVQRQFDGGPGQRFRPGDRVDSDVVNNWRNGQKLVASGFISATEEKRGRGRPRKAER